MESRSPVPELSGPVTNCDVSSSVLRRAPKPSKLRTEGFVGAASSAVTRLLLGGSLPKALNSERHASRTCPRQIEETLSQTSRDKIVFPSKDEIA